jgi:hypothetical protein
MWKEPMQIRNDNVSTVAYLNLALTWAKGVMVLLLAVFALIAVQNNDSDSPKPKAELIIEMNWEDFSNHDLDLWVSTPTNEIVFYAFREAMNGLVTLERDDRGINNSLDTKSIPTRQEAVVFRNLSNGNYAVTAHLYRAEGSGSEVGSALAAPIPFTVKIISLNPSYQVVFSKSFEFLLVREEKFVVRFAIEDGKLVIDSSDLPLSLLNGVFPDDEFVMPDGAFR